MKKTEMKMKYLLKCLAVRQQYLVLHATPIVLWKQLFNNIVQELNPPEEGVLDIHNLHIVRRPLKEAFLATKIVILD